MSVKGSRDPAGSIDFVVEFNNLSDVSGKYILFSTTMNWCPSLIRNFTFALKITWALSGHFWHQTYYLLATRHFHDKVKLSWNNLRHLFLPSIASDRKAVHRNTLPWKFITKVYSQSSLNPFCSLVNIYTDQIGSKWSDQKKIETSIFGVKADYFSIL